MCCNRRMTSTAGERTHALSHSFLLAVVAVISFVLSAMVALRRPVFAYELHLTQWFNDAPDWVAHLLWPVMQAGTVAGPIVAAVVLALRSRDRWLAVVTALTGLATWFAAKWIKSLVERGRPLAYLPGIEVREGKGTGLGYVSGHSAVAACTMVFVASVLPSRWRPVAALVAALVGIGRVVHGVHLPADVVGGWAFGMLLALAGLVLVQWIDRRSLPGKDKEST
jgi:membrane-associated phospholipid phosphatase